MNHETNPNPEPDPDERGVIIGGFAARQAAESAYWKQNFSLRPYVDKDARYADFGPAYDYGVDAALEHEGRAFDDLESELSRSWDLMRGQSALTWERARDAVRDAWERVRNLV